MLEPRFCTHWVARLAQPAVDGTSIVSIWRHEPGQMANAARTLGEAFPGRFVLGIGPSHQGAKSWHGRGYVRPLTDIPDYLRHGSSALGRPAPGSPGTAPDRRARPADDPVLAVHQAVVLGESQRRARKLAHEHVGRYLRAVNYRNNFLRSGFTESDVAGEGSERLIDALVAMGDADEVAARVREHLDAGADHVCVNPLGRAHNEVPVARLRELAERLEPVSRP